MSGHRIFISVSLSCLVAVFFVQCSKTKGGKAENSVVSKNPLKPGDDYKATMDAYNKAKDAAAKNRLWLDFLERNPDNEYTVGTIAYLLDKYFLGEKKDPEGAIKFALEHSAKIRDEKLKRRADSELIRFYGKIGSRERLRALADQIEARRGLTLSENIAVAEAALEAKDWELARTRGETLLKKNTPETIRAEAGQEKQAEDQIQRSLERNRGQALSLLGQAAYELNDTKAALDHFSEAAKLARYDYAGLPSWPFEDLNLYWAKALLRSGDARAALDKISRDAMIQGRKDALEVLGEAHHAAGIKGNVEEYVGRTRPVLAKAMPAFSAYDYNKKRVSYGDLKGKVTMLAFWSPT